MLTSNERMARACNDVAEALQRLAVAILQAGPCDRFTPPPGGGYVCASCGCEFQDHARRVVIPDPPASEAEPECGCSLYSRCEQHNATKPRGCTCNGPQYASSSCPVKDGTGLSHAALAHQYPDRDPALAD